MPVRCEWSPLKHTGASFPMVDTGHGLWKTHLCICNSWSHLRTGKLREMLKPNAWIHCHNREMLEAVSLVSSKACGWRKCKEEKEGWISWNSRIQPVKGARERWQSSRNQWERNSEWKGNGRKEIANLVKCSLVSEDLEETLVRTEREESHGNC